MLRRARTSVALALAAVAFSVAGPATAVGTAPMQALNVLPPGNSQLFTVAGQAAGQASGDPDDYGPNVDDQRDLYWSFDFKDGGLRPEPFCDTPQTPQGTTTICFDEWGVPAVYGDTAYDVWYGAGYALAQIRLFEMDAIRRIARGTLAELTGPGTVPSDVETRVLTYSEEEYEAQLARQTEEDRTVTQAYVDGVNAWIAELKSTRADQMPAEYALLTSAPEPLTTIDIAAIGVLMTREVASAGGDEMTNVEALQQLEAAYGRDEGRAAFQDLNWVEDEQASVTVFREEGVFPRQATDPADRQAVFDAHADWAVELPLDLAEGPGTGAHPEPTPDPSAIGTSTPSDGMTAEHAVARAVETLEAWKSRLDGGSWMAMIAPERTADGSTLLVSQPQLDQNPQQLVELEVHGAGYHARGATVPGTPVVGIGYNEHVAWALTTGNSKTIDSFIVEVRENPDPDGPPQYFHDGEWKDQECRTETVDYRYAESGVPAGPPVFTEDVEVCRTVHGPIVATTADGTLARAVQYHMWDREVDTIRGVLGWNRATNLEEFEAAMRQVTWNENTGYADRNGNIAYWHPGLHRERHPESDPRLPLPGDGSRDLGGYLDFEELPHVVNPDKGWIANWNNKPAHGWGDQGGLVASSYPSGHGHRVQNLFAALSERDDWTFEALRELDRYAAQHGIRVREFRPLILALQDRPDLTAVETAALELLAAWNGDENGEGADMEPPLAYTEEQYTDEVQATVGAGPTIFDAVVAELVEDVVGELAEAAPGLVATLSDKGRHVYDMGSIENLVLRVVDPSTSSITPSRDYLEGRSPEQAIRDAFAAAVGSLAAEQGDDPSAWRSDYGRMEAVCSATGILGPCGAMPFMERGAWIHLAGFPGDGTAAVPDVPDAPAGRRSMPATGGGVAALGAVLALSAGLVRSRRDGSRDT